MVRCISPNALCWLMTAKFPDSALSHESSVTHSLKSCVSVGGKWSGKGKSKTWLWNFW